MPKLPEAISYFIWMTTTWIGGWALIQWEAPDRADVWWGLVFGAGVAFIPLAASQLRRMYGRPRDGDRA